MRVTILNKNCLPLVLMIILAGLIPMMPLCRVEGGVGGWTSRAVQLCGEPDPGHNPNRTLSGIDPSNGVEVKLMLGCNTAVETIPMKMSRAIG